MIPLPIVTFLVSFVIMFLNSMRAACFIALYVSLPPLLHCMWDVWSLVACGILVSLSGIKPVPSAVSQPLDCLGMPCWLYLNISYNISSFYEDKSIWVCAVGFLKYSSFSHLPVSFIIIIFVFFLIFTTSCRFWPYYSANQLVIIHMPPPSWAFLPFSHPTPLDHCRAAGWVPVLCSNFPPPVLFYTG